MTGDTAGRWLRVSTRAQDETNQEPDVDAWIESHGYQKGPTYRIQVTAFKGHPKFDKMWQQVLDDFKAKRITVLVVWKQDRLDRKLNTLNMLRQVVDVAGRVEFVTQPHLNDLTTMGGRIALKVQEEIAYSESETRSDRVGAAFDRIDINRAIRGKAPYGFIISGDKYHRTFLVVKEQAQVIRDVYEWYMSGQSLAHICRKLNQQGRHTKKGREWIPKTLAQVLRKEALCGYYHQGDVIVEIPHILTVREWKALQDKLDERAYRKGNRTRDNTALLTSMLFCPHGKPMYRVQDRYYYVRGCCSLLIPIDVADNHVINLIKSLPSDMVITREIMVKGTNPQDQIDRLAIKMQKLNPLNFPSRNDYQAAQNALWDQIENLRHQESEPPHIETVEIPVSKIIGGWSGMTNPQRRELLLELGLKWQVEKVSGQWHITISPAIAALRLGRSS